MHKITIDGKEVQISDESYEALAKAIQPEKKGRWRAEKGNGYYYISDLGNVCDDIDDHMTDDNNIFNFGNYYKTREQAKQARDRQLALTRLRDYALENMPFEPDWSDDSWKYYVYCRPAWGQFRVGNNVAVLESTMLPYFKSNEDCQKFIKENEDDLRCVFNIK